MFGTSDKYTEFDRVYDLVNTRTGQVVQENVRTERVRQKTGVVSNIARVLDEPMWMEVVGTRDVEPGQRYVVVVDRVKPGGDQTLLTARIVASVSGAAAAVQGK